MTSIISCIMLTILLLALGKYFSVLPKAVLASIVVVNLRQVFKLMFESRDMTHRRISYEPYDSWTMS